MIEKRVAIVILNYLNYKDTIECIDSIEKMKYSLCGIVVVDNASNNNSVEKIRKACFGKKSIYFLRTHRNLGYAKGNNVGIHYARKYLRADYILVVNNDTLFIQKDYIERLLRAHQKGVAVIGSKILLCDGIQGQFIENFSLRDNLVKCVNRFTDSKGHCFDFPYKTYEYSYILNGCVLMFTPDFFNYYEGFYPRTFLYFEEIILYLMCQEKNLKQVYVDDAEIFHKVHGSSEVSFGNDRATISKYLLKSEKYVILWLIRYKIISIFRRK